MGLRTYTNWLLCLTAIALGASAWGLSIPPEQQDLQKIFFGVADKFEKPARVNYQEIVKATPEYSSIKKKKIVSGSAKYWILISKASERAQQLIKEVGEETDYDLIVADGYLETMEPAIP